MWAIAPCANGTHSPKKTNVNLHKQVLLKSRAVQVPGSTESISSSNVEGSHTSGKKRRRRRRKKTLASEEAKKSLGRMAAAALERQGVGLDRGITPGRKDLAKEQVSDLRTGEQKRANKRRVPRTAAVVLTCDKDDRSYAEVLAKARGRISLEKLGIQESRVRRAATGAFVIEITGDDRVEKADLLADEMRRVLKEEEVRISRPTRQAELNIWNFDQSVTKFEVALAVATIGEVALSEVKTGDIRSMRNGLCSVWIKCPLEGALMVVRNGTIKLGWTSANVELLKSRPLQCYKCFAAGHTRQRCPSEVDRTGLCFVCGGAGHMANRCKNKARCPVCAMRGLKSDHRAASEGCPPVKPRSNKRDVGSVHPVFKSRLAPRKDTEPPVPVGEKIAVTPDIQIMEVPVQVHRGSDDVETARLHESNRPLEQREKRVLISRAPLRESGLETVQHSPNSDGSDSGQLVYYPAPEFQVEDWVLSAEAGILGEEAQHEKGNLSLYSSVIGEDNDDDPNMDLATQPADEEVVIYDHCFRKSRNSMYKKEGLQKSSHSAPEIRN